MARTKLYQIYSDGVRVTNRITGNDNLPYYLMVRATGIRQAYWLAANRKLSTNDTEVGIVEIDHRDGPTAAIRFFTRGK